MFKRIFIILIAAFIFAQYVGVSHGASSDSGSSENYLDQYKQAKKFVERAKKLKMKVAAEIFADRNYEDDGNLVSRSKSNALITDPEISKKHVIKMVKNQALNCFSGKQIPCDIDSVCVHGDGKTAVSTAEEIKNGLITNGVTLRPLDLMTKFK